MILAGHEIATSDAFAEAAALAETLGAPVLQQTVVHGAHFPSRASRLRRRAQPRPEARAPRCSRDYDLMFCVGSDVLQMSVWSEVEPLPETTKVAMVGLRDWEMGKNFPAEIALRADVKETLKALVPLLEEAGRRAARRASAKASLAEIAPTQLDARSARPARPSSLSRRTSRCRPEWLMMRLPRALPEDAIVVDEGLTSAGSLVRPTSRSATATASSAMSAAASAGASPRRSACRSPSLTRRVVALIGDGSAMYSHPGAVERGQPEAAGDRS